MTTKWHVVRTKPQQELLAARGLREQGFVVYLAKKYSREMFLKKAVAVASLRFETYLFVNFDCGLEMHGPINNTRGVASSPGSPGLFCDPDGKPEYVPDIVMDGITTLEDEEFSAAGKPASKDVGRSDLKPGDKVRVDQRNRMYGGLQGLFVASERGKALVLVGSMGLRLPDVDLTRIEEKKPTSFKPKKVKR